MADEGDPITSLFEGRFIVRAIALGGYNIIYVFPLNLFVDPR